MTQAQEGTPPSSGARTLYDDVPYPSKSYAYAHPDRLNTIARLFGMAPVPLQRARILELGCGEGGHLIPIAAQLPDATVVGVDLAAEAIAVARQNIEALGLTNIQVHAGNIATFAPELSAFDYIIAHGVFSWVPANVRQAMLAFCKRHLSPQGVAYISYNCLPGWHLHRVTRDIMRVHAEQFSDPMEQVRQGQALVKFFAGATEGSKAPYAAVLATASRMIDKHDTSYFFHDFLSPENEPLLFQDFVALAEQHELGYLGDAMLGEMMPGAVSEGVLEVLNRIAPNLIRLEQYLDLIRGTSFRRSLLIHSEVELKRNLGAADLKGLYVTIHGGPSEGEIDVTNHDPVTFEANDGTEVTVGSPVGKAALLQLYAHRPIAMPFEALLDAALGWLDDPPTIEDATETLGGVLIHAYGAGLVDIVGRDRGMVNVLSDRPLADPYARHCAALGRDSVTNRRHEVVGCSRFDRELLKLLDGTRTVQQLRAALLSLIHEGVLTVKIDGEARTEPDVLEEALDTMLPARLDRLLRSAMLIG